LTRCKHASPGVQAGVRAFKARLRRHKALLGCALLLDVLADDADRRSTTGRRDQSRFVCTGCGHAANADTNAAIIILKRGLDKSLKPVEGLRSQRPDDAGSIRRAA
jgi:hypothetical protein